MRRLRLLPIDVEVPIREGETLLGAICRDGLTYKFGCRRGGCGVCKVDLESGEVVYGKVVADSVLTAEERSAGVVLSCRAEAASDEVVLRMPESSRLRIAVPIAFGVARRELEQRPRESPAGPGPTDGTGG